MASIRASGHEPREGFGSGGWRLCGAGQDRDRFAKEPAYHYLLRREFEEYGTKIRALNDRGDDTPEGEADLQPVVSLNITFPCGRSSS